MHVYFLILISKDSISRFDFFHKNPTSLCKIREHHSALATCKCVAMIHKNERIVSQNSTSYPCCCHDFIMHNHPFIAPIPTQLHTWRRHRRHLGSNRTKSTMIKPAAVLPFYLFMLLAVNNFNIAHSGGAVSQSKGTECSLCPNGDAHSYPDKSIPYFVLPGDETPTCSDLAFAASLVKEGDVMCQKYQSNAGYCGCPGEERKNICSFCSDGGYPAKANLILPSQDICRDLHNYVSYFDADQCDSVQFSAIVANSHHCGCADSDEIDGRQADLCTFCPDGSFPPDPDLHLELAGLTCGEYAAFINSLDRGECELQSSRGTFELFAFQCGCPGASPPECSIRENPDLCTKSLLETVDEDVVCECYSFCNEEFVGCDPYPGSFLGPECEGVAVTGCNLAGAVDDSGSCHICPDLTNNIGNPDAILPPFSGVSVPGNPEPTCQDLVDYIERTDVGIDCDLVRGRLAYYCGCDGTQPKCTLCPGGVQPSFSDQIATGDVTCGAFEGTVTTWEQETCDLGGSYLDVMAARCGCITSNWPVCPIRQNPGLCTTSLLASTNQSCACYNFCGQEFQGCADYPGERLREEDCPDGAALISGCNRELALSHRCDRGSITCPTPSSNLRSSRGRRRRE